MDCRSRGAALRRHITGLANGIAKVTRYSYHSRSGQSRTSSQVSAVGSKPSAGLRILADR